MHKECLIFENFGYGSTRCIFLLVYEINYSCLNNTYFIYKLSGITIFKRNSLRNVVFI